LSQSSCARCSSQAASSQTNFVGDVVMLAVAGRISNAAPYGSDFSLSSRLSRT
jgi:hypothetical protein